MYKTINGWTKEAMIRRVEERVPEKGSFEEGWCGYRDNSGGACAVGAFMPDDIAAQLIAIGFNGKGYSWLSQNMGRLVEGWAPLPDRAMAQMQIVHDDTAISRGAARDAVLKWIQLNVK